MNRRNFLKYSVIFGASLILPLPSFSQEVSKKKIFLTIDDGPRKSHREILSQLEGKGLATFFMNGCHMEKNLNLVVETIERGHDIGNHTYSHPRFSFTSLDNAKREIERTESLIEKAYTLAGINDPRLFRFPFGDAGTDLDKSPKNVEKKRKIEKFLEEKGYQTFRWDLDIEDWRFYDSKNPLCLQDILQNAKRVTEGEIVLAHDLDITARRVLPIFTCNDRYGLYLLKDKTLD
ncbi:MAG: polysaccharide deacetylase family protein, partial [archaeon]